MEDPNPVDHLVEVTYGQLYLAPINVSPMFDGRDEGSLVQVTGQGGTILVLTGCSDGSARVSIQMCTYTPPDPNNIWEVAEEVDVLMNSPLYLSSPTWLEGPFEPVLTPIVPGLHRVRVCGRGRNEAPKLSVMTSSERYLVQTWPTSIAAERRLLRDDGFHR